MGLRKPNKFRRENYIGIGELIKGPIKLIYKWGREKENPNPRELTLESFIRFSFWNPILLLQKKEILLRFLSAFGFCNQAKSLTPTIEDLIGVSM